MLSEAVAHLELAEEPAAQVRELLTDLSLCHSLWVIAEGKTRRWYRLFVKQAGDGENDAQEWSFSW
jgi:hypothetical protein